jgi:quercetin dioxygenase-like cupin family protein
MTHDESVVIAYNLGALELEWTQLAVYDQPIGIRLLLLDASTGAEHYLIRYPTGLKAKRHRHSVAQSVVVLEGKLEVNGTVIGPGSYCHFPRGVPMHHAPAGDEDCLFVTIFHGTFDVEVVLP